MVNVPTVGDCMSPYFVTLSPGEDIYEAIELLAAKRTSGAPVLDEQGELMGVLTEKDCLRVLSTTVYGELAHGTVGDFMSTVKATIDIEMDLFSAAKEFLATNFSVLPVLEGGKLVGRISRQDMLRGIQELQRRVAKKKKDEVETLETMQRPRGIQALQALVGSQKREQSAAVLSRRHEPKPPPSG